MKKIMYFSVLFVLAVMSCSKDSQDGLVAEPSGKAMRVGKSLQHLYDDMLKSTEYKDYEASLNTFVAKMGKDAEEEEFADETEILDWIEKNIARTTFSSYSSAQTEWKVVKEKFELVQIKNPGLINGDFDDDEWKDLVIQVTSYETNSSDPDCIVECAEAAQAAFSQASSVYKAGLRQAYALVALNPAAGAAATAVANFQFRAKNNKINQTAIWCMCVCDPALCPGN